MERSTILNRKTHYFDWAIFNSFLYVYQRVPIFSSIKIDGFSNKNHPAIGGTLIDGKPVWVWVKSLGVSIIGEVKTND